MPDVPVHLPEGPFAGPAAFAQLLRDALACAAREGWPEMVWCDADYLDWPLRERAVVEALNAWAGSGRRLLMLAHRYDEVQRHHARFVQWRGTWGHLVDCRVCRHLDASELPSALWSPHWVLRRLGRERCTGVASHEAQRRVLLREELEECRRQSSPGFPSTILGL
ncbi:hypothetical protein [uncultured Rhodoferax sp.]|uniref:hypothetical protein n=1 Tax=uncultured Rhodoferax sp. TaxID=223188 RepID=UPI0025E452FD|nr:hypothetical protein [uncultured Rhodoferax sp.]